jgi:hypothetical protein
VHAHLLCLLQLFRYDSHGANRCVCQYNSLCRTSKRIAITVPPHSRNTWWRKSTPEDLENKLESTRNRCSDLQFYHDKSHFQSHHSRNEAGCSVTAGNQVQQPERKKEKKTMFTFVGISRNVQTSVTHNKAFSFFCNKVIRTIATCFGRSKPSSGPLQI